MCPFVSISNISIPSLRLLRAAHSQIGGSGEKIASSSAPSTVSLGKRKACALSDTYASGSSRPAKVRKPVIHESELSVDTSIPAPVVSSDDPDAPIIIVSVPASSHLP